MWALPQMKNSQHATTKGPQLNDAVLELLWQPLSQEPQKSLRVFPRVKKLSLLAHDPDLVSPYLKDYTGRVPQGTLYDLRDLSRNLCHPD